MEWATHAQHGPLFERTTKANPLHMKPFAWMAVAIPLLTQAQTRNTAFQDGEKLTSRVHYGFVDAGTAELELKQDNKMLGNIAVYHAVGIGHTNRTFDWFFKVRDRYETYIDRTTLNPVLFIRKVDEGGYKINQNQIYQQKQNNVISDGKNMKVPDNIQDMLSAFYYARNIDYSNAAVGQVFTITTFVDNEIFPLKIRFVGKEVIDSDIGEIRCLKFHPVIQKGRVFKNEDDLNMYISDDANRIPIRVEAKLLVGSVRMDLKRFENVRNPLSLVR
jgi:hypothetical protein